MGARELNDSLAHAGFDLRDVAGVLAIEVLAAGDGAEGFVLELAYGLLTVRVNTYGFFWRSRGEATSCSASWDDVKQFLAAG